MKVSNVRNSTKKITTHKQNGEENKAHQQKHTSIGKSKVFYLPLLFPCSVLPTNSSNNSTVVASVRHAAMFQND